MSNLSRLLVYSFTCLPKSFLFHNHLFCGRAASCGNAHEDDAPVAGGGYAELTRAKGAAEEAAVG